MSLVQMLPKNDTTNKGPKGNETKEEITRIAIPYLIGSVMNSPYKNRLQTVPEGRKNIWKTELLFRQKKDNRT